MAEVKLSRRRFLQLSATAGGALLVGLHLPVGARRAMAAGGEDAAETLAPNAWIRIDPDDTVTFLVDKSEMGQGVMTALPMLLAEELEVDLDRVKTEFAPAGEAYINPLVGAQVTGGSTAVRSSWQRLREAGAATRALMINAAAEQWGVDAGGCRAEQGRVVHEASGRSARYGELVGRAASMGVPDTAFTKDPDEWRLIGTRHKRLDTAEKTDGSAKFGTDVTLPNMVTAMVMRPPVFTSKLESFDAAAAKQVKGVIDVFEISAGVAIAAEGFWPAQKARQKLKVKWASAPTDGVSTDDIRAAFKKAAREDAVQVRSDGDAAGALSNATKRINAEYDQPYQAHTCMEPMNCVADVRSDGCDIWVPTQAQGFTRDAAAKITGLSPDKIHVHTTFLGGGFGRRSETDFVRDAVEVSKAMGRPAKVVWMREDDVQQDKYRPASYQILEAGLDDSGKPVAWSHRIASPSIMSRVNPSAVQNGIDGTSVEGAKELPYAIPNLYVGYALSDPAKVPCGFWRSVGHSQNAFVTESFLDEVAHAGGQDPFELRRSLLADHPRWRGVLELAAEKAGWGKTSPPSGRGRGIAVHKSFASWVAQVAEVSVDDRGRVTVHKVVCAVDCGTVVNPAIIEAQMDSAIVYGLSAALKGEITIDNGRVAQSNFHDFPMLELHEMPEVEVHVVKSDAHPGGIGEPAVPPIAPAVTNAIFDLTGKRIRRLPIRPEDLAQA